MNKDIQELLVKNCFYFSEKTLEVLEMFSPGIYKKCEDISLTEGANIRDKVLVSILFTGTVYGEYILSVDKPSAVDLCSKISSENTQNQYEEFLEKLGELLNLIVGQSVAELNNSFEKLTITAPKVVF